MIGLKVNTRESLRFGSFFAFEVTVIYFLSSPECRFARLISAVIFPVRPGWMVESTPTAVHPHPGLTVWILSTESPVFLIR